jgi:hypothetical protein
MAWMSDEKYEYFQDTKDKAFTARSARNKKGHTGKGGGMKTASDFMSKKQLDSLNGECKTYKLGAPMSWGVFCEMPDDLKAMYIKSLRKKFNVPDFELATAMDVDIQIFTECLKNIRVKPLGADEYVWLATDDCGRFLTWWMISEEE